jgi:hypothetical protein
MPRPQFVSALRLFKPAAFTCRPLKKEAEWDQD